jgi:hypothetical protein
MQEPGKLLRREAVSERRSRILQGGVVSAFLEKKSSPRWRPLVDLDQKSGRSLTGAASRAVAR